jgi:hypothetical protein
MRFQEQEHHFVFLNLNTRLEHSPFHKLRHLKNLQADDFVCGKNGIEW